LDSIYSLFEKPRDSVSFDAMRIRIASPEKIRSWSFFVPRFLAPPKTGNVIAENISE
jgi:hypothetical protein